MFVVFDENTQKTSDYLSTKHIKPILRNFESRGPPLNVIQFQKYLALIFFIISGTTCRGERLKFLIFIFWLYTTDHPTVVHVFYALNIIVLSSYNISYMNLEGSLI